MSTSAGILGEEIDRQAALASIALQRISGTGTGALPSLPRAVLNALWPYSVALYIAERVVQSDAFDAKRARTLHSKLVPLERMADDALSAARLSGYFDDPDAAEPLRWLEACNEQVKHCMVALESMLDPKLADIMSTAMEEHRRGETVPLDSIL